MIMLLPGMLKAIAAEVAAVEPIPAFVLRNFKVRRAVTWSGMVPILEYESGKPTGKEERHTDLVYAASATCSRCKRKVHLQIKDRFIGEQAPIEQDFEATRMLLSGMYHRHTCRKPKLATKKIHKKGPRA